MRCGIVFAAALMLAGFGTVSPSRAQAEQYCGFTAKLGAIVQCGYSTIEGCENAIGKGAMCFVNPYVVLNDKQMKPTFGSEPPIGRA